MQHASIAQQQRLTVVRIQHHFSAVTFKQVRRVVRVEQCIRGIGDRRHFLSSFLGRFVRGLTCFLLVCGQHVEHLHQSIQQTMQLFKARALARTIQRAHTTRVFGADVRLVAQQHHIRHFEQTQRFWRRFVVMHCLQHAWQQRRARNLKFNGGRVGDRHGRAVIFTTQMIKIFQARTQPERQDLHVARLCQLAAHQIREFVQRLHTADGVKVWRCLFDFVITMCNGHIFHNITRVQNIRARDRHVRDQTIAVGFAGQRHALQNDGHLLGTQVNAHTLVDPFGTRFHHTRRQIRPS
mmetsp:Transcript_11207/g.18772  ORF Transcript_11207/g.18772 Transcript_11207/m.18772 type:complete len:295 (+) Transcript_11207:142-1026(+)